MKIAYIICSPVISSSNGVLNQALAWKQGLEKRGHQVTLVNVWNPCDWVSFDIIHLFMFTEYSADYIDLLAKINSRLVISPILDPDYSVFAFKMRSYFGNKKLKLYNRYSRLRDSISKIKQIYVRSDFEKKYFVKGLGVAENQIEKVPLSINFSDQNLIQDKEPFCFHVSFLADDRKNVNRLISAAEKYDFPLKLAGRLRNESERKKIETWLHGTKNVEYLGFLSYKDLQIMYQRAMVFALPSINEGVGIAALEAASNGCDVVITNAGGPQEYYGKYAKKVDPFSVDEIGLAVKSFLSGETKQPLLQEHLFNNYSSERTAKRLEEGYQKLC